MANESKTGALTVADLIAVWTAAVDPGYGAAFITAGDGGGFETYTQGFAQYARISQAIDTSTQALYILPASSQTAPPAMGENKATVSLSISRTKYLDRPLVIGAGQIFFGEQTDDWSITGPNPVQTGRLYTLQHDLVFLPGDSGPFVVTAVAAGPGWGYNNPLVGSITVIEQVGSGFYNNLAAVTVTAGQTPPTPPPPAIVVSVISNNQPDTFVPEHIGQYMLFTAGANVGILARITMFAPPQPPVFGSTVQLEDFVAFEAYGAVTGTFQIGEQVQIKNGVTVVGTGTLKAVRAGNAGHTKVGLVLTTGTIAVGNTLLGVVSAATVAISLMLAAPAFVAEAPLGGVGGASWKVLDWVTDIGLSVTNTTQPAGGTLGMLDAIGADRNIPRLPGEPDDAYRIRIWQIADVVTPNAVIRALNRMLGAIPYCFREVGSARLPGFFYDGNNETATQAAGTFTPDAYDYDVLIFSGTLASGTFVPWPIVGTGAPSTWVGQAYTGGFQEPVQYRDVTGIHIKATGYLGSVGSNFTMIRKGGQGSLARPVVVETGDYIIGMVSGAIWNVSTVATLATPAQFRFHVYLDYTDFRAMFLVGLPRVNYGEFGFAWAGLPHGTPGSTTGAYDVPSIDNFYDGFAVGSRSLYLSVYNQINRVKAGGVSWYEYLEDGTCI